VIALDTNLLVRFLVKDDEVQTRRVVALMKRALDRSEALYVCDVVLCELVWVLETSYGVEREEIASNLAKLLRARQLTFRDADLLSRALEAYHKGRGDFADYLIREDARSAGAEIVATFDKALLKDMGFQPP
jgi:predicted nucleic-acid-binding protein